MKLKSQFFDIASSDKKGGYYNNNNIYVSGSNNYNKSKKSKMLDYKDLITSSNTNTSTNYYKNLNIPSSTKNSKSHQLEIFNTRKKEELILKSKLFY